MEAPSSLDPNSIYLTAEAGQIVRQISSGNSAVAMIEFGALMIDQWTKHAKRTDSITFIANTTTLGIFKKGIVVLCGSGARPEILGMAFGVSIEDWDEYGPGNRTIDAETMKSMAGAFDMIKEVKEKADSGALKSGDVEALVSVIQNVIKGEEAPKVLH